MSGIAGNGTINILYMHSNISIFMSVLVGVRACIGYDCTGLWPWFFPYDTMCYDNEHGASDTCKATDVFSAR